jgi:hypothetical protein
MSKFSVGQKVRLVEPTGWHGERQPEAQRFIGATATIIDGPFQDDRPTTAGRYGPRYGVDVISPAATLYPVEACLVPLYDGDIPASWETCAWRPRETLNVQA